MLLAYLKLTYERASKAKGWIFPAIVRLYEQGIDDRIVCKELIETRQIRSEGPFYTAKSRFLADWKAVARRVEKKIFDKHEIKGKKREFNWTPKVSCDVAQKMVRALSKEIQAQVGRTRFKDVQMNFMSIMQRLALEADEKVAEKNACKYK